MMVRGKEIRKLGLGLRNGGEQGLFIFWVQMKLCPFLFSNPNWIVLTIEKKYQNCFKMKARVVPKMG